MSFVAIEPGRVVVEPWLMDEGYELRVDSPYLIGIHEVTVAQWATLMEEPAPERVSAQLPRGNVTFEQALRLVERINQVVGDGYVAALPTETQWEYACRAGNAGWSPARESREAFDASVWHRENSGARRDPQLAGDGRVWDGLPWKPVATKRPNAWGLYDMLGNVSEYCVRPLPGSESQSVDSLKGMVCGGNAGTPPLDIRPGRRGTASAVLPPFAVGVRVVMTRAKEKPRR